MSKGRVAVIGGGISGLSCARALRDADVEVVIYERAAKVGGRCASRLWQGHLVDFGVQYFHAQTFEFKRELVLRLRQFRALTADIIDAQERVIPSTQGARFYVLQGNNYLAQILARELDVRLKTQIEALRWTTDNQIEVAGEPYNAVVSSLPGPQTWQLFRLEEAEPLYQVCLIALVEYPVNPLDAALTPFYGRQAPPSSSTLAISYQETHKLGRMVGAKSVFVLQANSVFSEANQNRAPEDYLPPLLSEHEELWRIRSGQTTARFGHRWGLAWPRQIVTRPSQFPPGAFACGDAWGGSSVENVWHDGRRAARDVIAYLAGR